MELRVLQYFLVAAREENMTKAAQLLHVTQPTLSRQIMQLEEELGVKLFRRSNHNIILTDDGMLLKRRAGELLELADKTKRDFQHDRKTLMGEVVIGSGEFLNSYYLAGVVAAFRVHHPLVQFRFYSDSGEHIRDNIERGLLDIGVVAEPIDIRKFDFLELPVAEKWARAMVPVSSPLADKEILTPEDLCMQPLILTSNETSARYIFEWFGDYRDQLHIAATSNLQYYVAQLVRQGAGIGIAMDLHTIYEGLTLVPLASAWNPHIVASWKKNQILSRTVQAFLAYLKDDVKRYGKADADVKKPARP